MKRVRRLLPHLALLAVLSAVVHGQDAPPRSAFKTVHLVNLTTPAEVAKLQAAITDMNAVLAKAGYADVRYRLYKISGKQAGPYAYLWESTWPGAEAYEKVHQSADWTASSKKHQLDALMKDEVYNRYVEVTAAK
jgi:hypothetical protein